MSTESTNFEASNSEQRGIVMSRLLEQCTSAVMMSATSTQSMCSAPLWGNVLGRSTSCHVMRILSP